MTGPRRGRRKRAFSPDDSPDLPDIGVIIKTSKKTRQSLAEKDKQNPQPTESDIQIAHEEAPKRYETRNRDRRPGIEAGLAPRTRNEIHTAAQAKKAKLAAEQAQIEAEQADKDAERGRKVDQFARIMDQQAREREVDAMSFADTDALACALEMADRDPAVGTRMDSHIKDERDDRASPVTPKQHVWQDQENEQPPKQRGKRQNSKASQSHNNASATLADSDVEMVEPEAPAKKKPLTQKEKRALRQETVLTDLQSRRDTSTSTPRAVSQPATPASVNRSTSNHESSGLTAFNDNWRRRIMEHTKSPAPRKKAAPKGGASGATTSAPSTPVPLSFRKAVSSRPVEDKDRNFETQGGLADDEISVSRDAALSTARRLTSASHTVAARVTQPLRIDDVPDRELDKKSKNKKSKNKNNKKKRSKSSSDTEASDSDSSSVDESLSYDNLPPFVKPLIKDEGMPTIYDYLGSQDDSWELNTDKYKFLALVQKMLDDVFPHKPYELKKKDIIYKWCRQQVYEWHRGFQRTANNVVRTEIELRRADVRLPKEDRSDTAILAWLENAIAKGGEATWGRPDIIEPTRAKDQLQSKFVLKVVAYHLGMCVGSIRFPEPDEHSDPVGALALAACAVERAFLWYSENQLKGLPQLKFSKKKAGKDTGKWRDTAVQDLIEKPHRLDRLFISAAALVAVPARSSAPTNTVNRLYVRERSSSPPTVPYDAYDEDT